MTKFNQLLIGLLIYFFSSSIYAFSCYLTIMKSSCWQDFDVTITATDQVSHKQVIKAQDLKKNNLWTRTKFECSPRQGLVFQASFTPAIWQGTGNKMYQPKRVWFLPSDIEKGITSWNIPICYPSAFIGVPLPPNAKSLCTCENVKKDIPAIPIPVAKSN